MQCSFDGKAQRVYKSTLLPLGAALWGIVTLSSAHANTCDSAAGTYAQLRVSADHYTEQPDLTRAPTVDALGRKLYPKRYCLKSADCTTRDSWLTPADFAALLVNHKPVHCYTLQHSITFKAGVKTDNRYFNVYYSAD